jgi:hypothetical protein
VLFPFFFASASRQLRCPCRPDQLHFSISSPLFLHHRPYARPTWTLGTGQRLQSTANAMQPPVRACVQVLHRAWSTKLHHACCQPSDLGVIQPSRRLRCALFSHACFFIFCRILFPASHFHVVPVPCPDPPFRRLRSVGDGVMLVCCVALYTLARRPKLTPPTLHKHNHSALYTQSFDHTCHVNAGYLYRCRQKRTKYLGYSRAPPSPCLNRSPPQRSTKTIN